MRAGGIKGGLEGQWEGWRDKGKARGIKGEMEG